MKVFEEIEEEIRLKWDPIIRERKAKLLEAYREWSRFNYEEYLNDPAPPTRTPTPSGMTTCVANDAQSLGYKLRTTVYPGDDKMNEYCTHFREIEVQMPNLTYSEKVKSFTRPIPEE